MATTPSATLPSVTVMLNDLSLALNEMGLSDSVSAAELFHRLQTIRIRDSTIPSIRNLPDIVIIHTNALGAALANLNITDITAAQLLDAIKKEGPTIPDRTNTLELESPPDFSGDFLPPYKSTVIMRTVDPEERARRLRQRDHFRKEFPVGMITNPYHATWLKQFDNAETKDLPLIPPPSVPDSNNHSQSSTQDIDK